jgi:hypothetical protein
MSTDRALTLDELMKRIDDMDVTNVADSVDVTNGADSVDVTNVADSVDVTNVANCTDELEAPVHNSSNSMNISAEASNKQTDFGIDTSKIRLVIATPCYGGGVQAHYLISLINTVELLQKHGITYEISLLPGDSLVPRARNALVAKFLTNPKNTHLLFIDADIHWNPMEVIKLLGHDKPLVGGLYPKKSWRWDKLKDLEKIKSKATAKHNEGIPESSIIQHNLLDYDLNYIPGKQVKVSNNLVELRHIATGFMMIQREVLTRMIECIGDEIKYTDDCGALNSEENPFLYAFFDCQVKRDHYLSEDWLFCDRWRQMGGKVFGDITIALTHLGYSGFPGRYLSTVDINA